MKKLMYKQSLTKVTDIHTNKLYELTTRHQLSLSQFIGGFINNPAINCKTQLKSCAVILLN